MKRYTVNLIVAPYPSVHILQDPEGELTYYTDAEAEISVLESKLSAAEAELASKLADLGKKEAQLADATARIVRLLGFVVEEARSACSPEPEELLVATGLATWEKYSPDRHGEMEHDPEPGARVWVLTDEALRLMHLTPPAAEGASDGQ